MSSTTVGKNAVITGGLGGIGMEIVRAMLKQHVKKMAIMDKCGNDVLMKMLKAEFPDRVIMFVATDVAKKTDVTKAYAAILKELKEIHLVVNCAGVLNDTDIETTIGVNVNGVILSTLIAREYMRKDKGGKGGIILNVASILGLCPIPAFPTYCASKWAVNGFTRAMGHDFHLEQTGVKYMSICPGITKTPLAEGFGRRVWDREWETFTDELLDTFPTQAPDAVGRAVITAINSGKNGSMWQSDANVVTEVTPHDAYDIVTLMQKM